MGQDESGDLPDAETDGGEGADPLGRRAGQQKKQLCFATPKGEELDRLHQNYDTEVFGKTPSMMGDGCSEKELALCFHVLEEFIKARQKKHYRSRPLGTLLLT